MHTFPITITKLDSVIFHGEAEAVTAPGIDGEMTVLKDHIPLLTTLKEGTIRIKKSDGVEEIPVQKGTLEVSKQGVTILI